MTRRLALSALVASVQSAGAQVVRGVVRDAATGSPMPGVIVSLEHIDDRGHTQAAGLNLSVLSNERGEYSIRAPAGTWAVTAKRVGLKRFVSSRLQLNEGESRQQDIVLSPIDFSTALAAVTVTTDAPCATRPRDATRVAALWEEARAALTASRIVLRDRLVNATVVRYERELSPGALRVLRDDHVTRHGVIDRAFVSRAAAELSSRGYVEQDQDGGWVFYAPDAEVLTSADFLRDHCFSLARATRDRPSLVGLAFEPASHQRQPGIRGAMWLDSLSYGLKVVEFGYVNGPSQLDVSSARGEVQFGRQANGTWYVSKWFIRTPQYQAARASASIPVGGRPTVAFYRETGGDVTLSGAEGVRTAMLRGRATDSTGAGIRDAVVRLAGTPYTAPVQRDGFFTLESLAAGRYTLQLEHPGYRSLGLLAAEQELEVLEGTSSITALQALGSEQVLRRLCGVDRFGDDRSAMRVTVQDSAGRSVQGVEVRAVFQTFAVGPAQHAVAVRPITDKRATDSLGVAMLCELPARQPVAFEVELPGRRQPVKELRTLAPGTISVVTLKP